MTLNDLNIDDKFKLPQSRKTYIINTFEEFVDEDSGDIVLMLEVANLKTEEIHYMNFDTQVIKI